MQFLHSSALESYGDPLPLTDAHGSKHKSRTELRHFVGCRPGDAYAGHAGRMPKLDRANVTIDACTVIGDAEIPQHRQALGGKGFIRSRLIANRTNLICQMRSYCLEHGVLIPQGAGEFKIDILRVLDDDTNDLTSLAREILQGLHDDLIRLERRIAAVSKEIEEFADADKRARRLMTIPGIGAIGATAIIAAIGDTSRLKRARDVAA